MQWLQFWNKSSSSQHQHNKNNCKTICCSDLCKHNDRYICDQQSCINSHKGHLTMNVKQYKQTVYELDRQIKYREQIQQSIKDYYHSIILQFTNLFQKQSNKLIQDIDKNFFSKDFVEIYQRYKNNGEYMSYLVDYQAGAGLQISQTVRKKIKQKQKYIPQLCKQFAAVESIRLDQRILPHHEKMREIISVSKIQKIKSLLPFQCELIPRYTASIHKFSTKALHSKSLRGPIIVVAQSYKNRTFGGYSPRMFPKQQKYEEDMHCRSFLFSLDDRIRIPLKQEYKKFAIKGGDNLWFGRGDLAISNQCHKANISWSELGRAYQVPKAAIGRQDQWLAGAKYFRIVQYQIYQVDTGQQRF